MAEKKLLDHKGIPLAPSSASNHKKSTAPILGESFGVRWTDQDRHYCTFPGGGIVQFNLDRLQLSDFRLMKDHYQVNASLAVLTFMMHQLDWKIESSSEKVRKHCEENLRAMWTRLISAVSQSFWAGYSPNVLQWENDMNGKTIQLTKIKDLVPEDCLVNWREVEGWAPPGHTPPKLKVYDGIKQFGSNWPIPADNSFWYPLLKTNGDWYGRKLLRPAFTSWYFSIIMHLFSNRYFERFGEPLPIGRAPVDEEIEINGDTISGMDAMTNILTNLRNRGVVILPSDRSVMGTETKYDYSIEYLESQMRGADFERYMMRLDEEISLSLFTPLLMLRTADVGSYNLGSQHVQVYSQMLNALAGDLAQYINEVILERMVNFNFSPSSPRARIKFRKLGDDKSDFVKAVLQVLLASGKAMPDLKELGEIAGLTINEVDEVLDNEKTEPKSKPNAGEDNNESEDEKSGEQGGNSNNSSHAIIEAIYRRVSSQVVKAFRDGTFGNGFVPDIGYAQKLTDALRNEGVNSGDAAATYAIMDAWVKDLATAPFSSADELNGIIKAGLEIAHGKKL